MNFVIKFDKDYYYNECIIFVKFYQPEVDVMKCDIYVHFRRLIFYLIISLTSKLSFFFFLFLCEIGGDVLLIIEIIFIKFHEKIYLFTFQNGLSFFFFLVKTVLF